MRRRKERNTHANKHWNYLNKEAQAIHCACIPSPLFKVQRFIKSYHILRLLRWLEEMFWFRYLAFYAVLSISIEWSESLVQPLFLSSSMQSIFGGIGSKYKSFSEVKRRNELCLKLLDTCRNGEKDRKVIDEIVKELSPLNPTSSPSMSSLFEKDWRL